jgi:hypothetical protein
VNSLLKELSKGSLQADLKISDGSAAGSRDVISKPVDVGFSLMRNMINTDGQVSGSDVNDYLERAQDLDADVESVGFAIETDDGDIIKIYVSAIEADEFEQEMSKLLGMEGDVEEAINQLAQKFDIVDVVWPRDPEGAGEQDPDADLSIDDDTSVFASTEPETPEDGSVLPADDDGDGRPDADGGEVSADDDAVVDDEDFEDIPRASETAVADPDVDVDADPDADPDATDETPPADDAAPEDEPAEDEMEPVLNDDGSQKLDKDGEPVMRKKKKEKAKKEPSLDDLSSGEDESIRTEEGLLRSFTKESVRDDIVKHVREVEALGNRGKYQIMATVSGGVTGRRTAPLKKDGEIAYFDNEATAKTEADRLTKYMNRAGATASYTYIPKLVESKQLKENTMTIGSNFLSRLAEAKGPIDVDAVKDGMNIPLDTQQRQLVTNLKKPIEKKIIALFAMAGVIGRMLKAEPDVEDRVRAAGDMLRKNAAARNAFTAFYNGLANAKGFGIKVEKKDPHTEPKRGASVQQKFEAVMVALGLPEGLITVSGPNAVGTFVTKTAKLIDASGDLQTLLANLAVKLGVRGPQAPEDRVKTESVIGRAFMTRVDEAAKRVSMFAQFRESPDSESETQAQQLASIIADIRDSGGTVSKKLVVPGKTREEDEIFIIAKASTNDADDVYDAIDSRDDLFSILTDEHDAAGFAKAAGKVFKLTEATETQSNDPYVKDVLALLRALGVPEENLAYKRTTLLGSLKAARDKLKSRQIVDTKIEQLANVIASQQKAEQSGTGASSQGAMGKGPALAVREGLMTEAFNELEAMTRSDANYYKLDEPAFGPAHIATYPGGNHDETVLTVGIDVQQEGHKSLRVGIDGPWDGQLHTKFFADDEEGFKNALKYANMLRTITLKQGGRPKGWK